MFEFIPIEYYYDIYINVALFVALSTILHSLILDINNPKNINYANFIGYFLFFFALIYIGFRPMHQNFGDMGSYGSYFINYAQGGKVVVLKDPFFHYFMKFTSYFIPFKLFFLLCAFLYIWPMYKVSKSLFKEKWFYLFFMFIVSFSFWGYAVNGIRNGIATSLFLLAISYRNNRKLFVLLLVLSSLTHQTLILPCLALLLTFINNNSKYYIAFWLLSIPLSLALGSFWQSLFANLGFADDRVSGYLLSEANTDQFSSIGFRWDFVIYSASAVVVGSYFIIKKKFTDKLYFRLFNTYLICNAFWILVIRAGFSNRFAYLSWFMIGIIIIYPFLKEINFKYKYRLISRVLFVYFMFTFLMYFIYYADKH